MTTHLLTWPQNIPKGEVYRFDDTLPEFPIRVETVGDNAKKVDDCVKELLETMEVCNEVMNFSPPLMLKDVTFLSPSRIEGLLNDLQGSIAEFGYSPTMARESVASQWRQTRRRCY